MKNKLLDLLAYLIVAVMFGGFIIMMITDPFFRTISSLVFLILASACIFGRTINKSR